jgi:hypothetical protein
LGMEGNQTYLAECRARVADRWRALA